MESDHLRPALACEGQEGYYAAVMRSPLEWKIKKKEKQTPAYTTESCVGYPEQRNECWACVL